MKVPDPTPIPGQVHFEAFAESGGRHLTTTGICLKRRRLYY